MSYSLEGIFQLDYERVVYLLEDAFLSHDLLQLPLLLNFLLIHDLHRIYFATLPVPNYTNQGLNP